MTDHSTAARKAADESDAPVNLRALLVLMCLALALIIGATSSLTVALPPIAAAIGASQTDLTWIINAYVLAFAALLLPAGIATDKYGRRTALMIGLSVFGVASLTSGFATSPEVLIALRIVAGAGATLVMPATLSVLVDSFPDDRRDAAIATWAGVSGAGALVGVMLAGVLVEFFWWGSIQVVYGIAGLLLIPPVLRLVPNLRNRALRLDPPGSVLAVIGLAGIVYGVIEGPEKGWSDPVTVTALVVGALGLLAFIAVELRVREPMLDVRLFRSRGLSAGSLLVLLLSVGAFGFFLLAPQFFQLVKGYGTLQTSLAILPFAVGIAPASQLSPRLAARFGSRWTGSVGVGTMAAGSLLFAVVAEQAYWQFGVTIVVFAFGMGLALTAGTTLIIAGLPADRRTLSAAVNDVTREVGAALGAALAGSILVSLYANELEPALSGIQPDLADAAREGAGQALAAAGPAGAGALVRAAQDSFTNGYQGAMMVGAAVMLGTAVLIGLLAPSKENIDTDLDGQTTPRADDAELSARTE